MATKKQPANEPATKSTKEGHFIQKVMAEDGYSEKEISDRTRLPLKRVREHIDHEVSKGRAKRKNGVIYVSDSPQQRPDRWGKKLRRQKATEAKESPKRVPSGTGLPRQLDPLLRCKVEEAARIKTIDHFQEQGYKIEPRDKDNLGWDMFATRGSSKLRLEVKGLSGGALCVELTPNEYKMLRKFRLSYRICVVTRALVNPKLSVFTYNAKQATWKDEVGRALRIEKLTGARCRTTDRF